MKVNIGPYLKYWGPYQIAKLLKYVGVSKDKYRNIGSKLANTKLNDLCEWIESKRKRKIKVKIDHYDIWSLDYTLSLIILPALKMVKENKCGTPSIRIEDIPKELLLSDEELKQKYGYSPDDDIKFESQHNEAAWELILDKMIWSFETMLNDKAEDKFFEKGFDSVGIEEHNKKLQEGFDLFGRYFRALWD